MLVPLSASGRVHKRTPVRIYGHQPQRLSMMVRQIRRDHRVLSRGALGLENLQLQRRPDQAIQAADFLQRTLQR